MTRRPPRPARLTVVCAVLAALTVGALSGLTRADAPYRPPGATLLHEAARLNTDDRLNTPALPLPVLLARVGQTLSGAPSPYAAAALGGCLALALAAFLVVWATGSIGGPWAALVAALTFVLIPGTLFAGRSLGPEAAAVLGYAALIAASTLRHPVPRALAGSGALLLCLGSAHESIVLVLPWFVAACVRTDRPSDMSSAPGTVQIGRLAPSIVVPMLAAPALLFWLWPYLGQDGGKRWLSIIYDPMRAAHPAFMVAGHSFDQLTGRAPNILAAGLTWLLRVPIPVALLVGLGAIAVVRSLRHRPAGALGRGLFALGAALTLFAVSALNGSPYYAGLDSFASAIPALSLLAGLGGARLARGLSSIRSVGPVWTPIVGVLVLAGPVALSLANSWDNAPGYFNSLTLGPAGAARAGFEPAPIPMLSVEALSDLNQALPERARLAFEPEGQGRRDLLSDLKRRGLLRADIDPVALFDATWILLSERPGHRLFQLMRAALGSPEHRWSAGGTTQLSLFSY